MLREGGRVLVIGGEAEPERRAALAGAGADVVAVALRDGRPDLTEVLRLLAGLEVNEVLVEAGSVLTGAFIAAGLVDELVVYLAPKLLGSDGIPMAAFGGHADLKDCPALEITDVRPLGPDWRITARPRPNPARTPLERPVPSPSGRQP
jgi:diaminohydroxyphosphoribosylaminopyrimidine deaminase/5-amino-6-(5-phosphoribosylamino)uracil reductase